MPCRVVVAEREPSRHDVCFGQRVLEERLDAHAAELIARMLQEHGRLDVLRHPIEAVLAQQVPYGAILVVVNPVLPVVDLRGIFGQERPELR